VEEAECAKSVKTLRITTRNAQSIDWIVIAHVLSHLKLETLKTGGMNTEELVRIITRYQPGLKQLVLPEATMEARFFGRLFTHLPELKVFKGRIYRDEYEHEEEEAAALAVPPTFQLRELYCGWGPRQDAFDYVTQFSLDSLTYLNLTMNDWRATMDLSKLTALRTLVIVANSHNRGIVGPVPECLMAFNKCMESVKTLSITSLSIQGTLDWAKQPSYFASIISSLPTSLEELVLGQYNSHSFNFQLFRQQIRQLPSLRRLVLDLTRSFADFPDDEYFLSLALIPLMVTFRYKRDQRFNSYLGEELDPVGASSEVDSDLEEDEEENNDEENGSDDDSHDWSTSDDSDEGSSYRVDDNGVQRRVYVL